MNDYYVYVYIDPRSYEEFYYGKGRGDRKREHLKEDGDSEKARRIKEIQADGKEPIIKVIAARLSEDQALLVEKTLIWKLGRTLTNKSSGHYSDHFRPHRTFDRELPDFDYANGIYYVNVGEGEHRNWDDCRKYGFLSAGQGAKWRDQISRLLVGDVVVAYLAKAGFVGIGVVEATAVPVREFRIGGKSLREMTLVAPKVFEHEDEPDRCEYPVRVRWERSVPRQKAYFQRKSGLFTTQLVRASLAGQPTTLSYLEQRFAIELTPLLTGA